MRLKITKSKNNVHYSIIKDYTPLNGKRTTKVYENLGNQKKVEERFGLRNSGKALFVSRRRDLSAGLLSEPAERAGCGGRHGGI